VKIDAVHASGDTFLRLMDTKSDINNLLDIEAIYYTITEAGEKLTMKMVEDLCKQRPYLVINPDRGDILFLLHKSAHLLNLGGPLVLPAVHKPVTEGGHGARHNSWMNFRYSGEVFFHTGVHLVTAHSFHAGGGPLRTDEQNKQMQLVGEQMRKFGSGTALATGSGDLNTSLPENKQMEAIMDRYGMTTASEETGNLTSTHGTRRIDYFWTLDKDQRLSVESMRVLKGKKYLSDHDPIHTKLNVRDR
jgi:hypothetical protein